MGRARNPRRDEALRQYVKSGGEMQPCEIGKLLGIPANRVRKWKSDDKWDEVLALPPEQRNIKKKIGPPFGSKNALGNRGGKGGPIGNQNAKGNGAPKGNTNALKTGEYATISLETLTQEEKDMFFSVDDDPVRVINDRIKFFMIRERRMLIELNKLKQQKEVIETDEHVVLRKGDTIETPSIREMTKRHRLLIDKIIAAEEALTRVQDRLLRAIEQQQKLIQTMREDLAAEKDVVVFSFERK